MKYLHQEINNQTRKKDTTCQCGFSDRITYQYNSYGMVN